MAASIPKLMELKPDWSNLARTPSLQRPAERRCATCNAQEQLDRPFLVCGQCRGALLCSEGCARENGDRHRKLCFKYKVAKHPDGGNHVRAVLFPAGKQKPEIHFVDAINWEADAEHVVSAPPT